MAKGEISLKLKAEAMGRDLEMLGSAVEAELQEAVKMATYGAYAKIVAEAQEKLQSTRQDYLKGLSIETIGPNQYLINLQGNFSEALERGWEAFDMRQKMLKSTKTVEVGSRSGLPWVQTGKKGQKYAHVPFEHKPFSKAPGASDMAALLRGIQTTNASGRKQKLTAIFTDPSGKALQGKVAKVGKGEVNSKDLEGLVKYQKVTKNEKTGKDTVSSVYMTYRTVSENGKAWMHPGNPGLHAFEQAEKWLDTEIDNILRAFTE